MRQIVRFARLPSTDRALLVQAAALLGATRVALWMFPFGIVQRVASRLERGRRPGPIDSDSARRVIWAIDAASRYIPASKNCLNRALTAKVLLARYGLSTHLRIGVRRDGDGELMAHAWVESAGDILIGDVPNLSRYSPLHPRVTADP